MTSFSQENKKSVYLLSVKELGWHRVLEKWKVLRTGPSREHEQTKQRGYTRSWRALKGHKDSISTACK